MCQAWNSFRALKGAWHFLAPHEHYSTMSALSRDIDTLDSQVPGTSIVTRIRPIRDYGTLHTQSSLTRIQYPQPGPISVRSFRKGGAAVLYFFQGSAASHAS